MKIHIIDKKEYVLLKDAPSVCRIKNHKIWRGIMRIGCKKCKIVLKKGLRDENK